MNIPDEIEKIALKYNVIVNRDTINCEKNQAACAGMEIFLGDFDSESIELVAFFHELGHVLSNERVFKRGQCMSTLSSEGTAWEIGLGVAFENGYCWDYKSMELDWARSQLRSYVNGEYDDTDTPG